MVALPLPLLVGNAEEHGVKLCKLDMQEVDVGDEVENEAERRRRRREAIARESGLVMMTMEFSMASSACCGGEVRRLLYFFCLESATGDWFPIAP